MGCHFVYVYLCVCVWLYWVGRSVVTDLEGGWILDDGWLSSAPAAKMINYKVAPIFVNEEAVKSIKSI